MSLRELLTFAETLHQDVDFNAVRDWREEHGGAKAVACLPIYFPRELIDAAGMLPVGLRGAAGQLEIIRGDAYFQSYICQLPRSTIELALSGKLAAIDGFIFPSICDVIRNLSGMWQILFPDKYVRYFDVPQNYARQVGGDFYAKELQEIRRGLSGLCGHPITDDDLRASIGRYNAHRRAVRSLLELRRQEPWRVPAHESYLVMNAGNLLPVGEHQRMIEDYCAMVREEDRPRRDHTKVVTIGSFCEQPPLSLIKTLELSGCYIVWDDTNLGQHWIETDVATEGDPIEALAQAFLEHSVSNASRYEPGADKGASLLAKFAETGAEGVMFLAPSFCDPALLDQPMLQTAADRAGVPWTACKYAENLGQFQVIREQAGTFADSVKLWSER